MGLVAIHYHFYLLVVNHHHYQHEGEQNYIRLISASGDDRPVPVDDLLELITSKNLPQLLIDRDFLPPRKALSDQVRNSRVQVALLLGVIWGAPTNSNGSRVFSAVTSRIENRLPLIAAVLQGDVGLIEVL